MKMREALKLWNVKHRSKLTQYGKLGIQTELCMIIRYILTILLSCLCSSLKNPVLYLISVLFIIVKLSETLVFTCYLHFISHTSTHRSVAWAPHHWNYSGQHHQLPSYFWSQRMLCSSLWLFWQCSPWNILFHGLS